MAGSYENPQTLIDSRNFMRSGLKNHYGSLSKSLQNYAAIKNAKKVKLDAEAAKRKQKAERQEATDKATIKSNQSAGADMYRQEWNAINEASEKMRQGADKGDADAFQDQIRQNLVMVGMDMDAKIKELGVDATTYQLEAVRQEAMAKVTQLKTFTTNLAAAYEEYQSLKSLEETDPNFHLDHSYNDELFSVFEAWSNGKKDTFLIDGDNGWELGQANNPADLTKGFQGAVNSQNWVAGVKKDASSGNNGQLTYWRGTADPTADIDALWKDNNFQVPDEFKYVDEIATGSTAYKGGNPTKVDGKSQTLSGYDTKALRDYYLYGTRKDGSVDENAKKILDDYVQMSSPSEKYWVEKNYEGSNTLTNDANYKSYMVDRLINHLTMQGGTNTGVQNDPTTGAGTSRPNAQVLKP